MPEGENKDYRRTLFKNQQHYIGDSIINEDFYTNIWKFVQKTQYRIGGSVNQSELNALNTFFHSFKQKCPDISCRAEKCRQYLLTALNTHFFSKTMLKAVILGCSSAILG